MLFSVSFQSSSARARKGKRKGKGEEKKSGGRTAETQIADATAVVPTAITGAITVAFPFSVAVPLAVGIAVTSASHAEHSPRGVASTSGPTASSCVYNYHND